MAGQACPINIGRKQRQRRLRMGWVFTVLSAAAVIALIATHAHATTRLAAVPLFGAAAVYFFQVREKT
jgi:hypothetical protein